jgi:hypothetical protein
MRRDTEQYVRPALVAREAPSTAFARWRFRLLAVVVLVLLVALVVLAFVTFSGVGAEDPGLSGGLSQHVTLSGR